MALQPLPDRTLADDVADQLRTAIVEGRLRPGERLVERRLAAQLGVSHIPVREALARLVDEGLVTHAPRRGARVATLSAREVEELGSLRSVLEQFVAERVRERLTPATEAKLRRTVEAMVAAADRGDARRVLDLDERFHVQLWELTDHQLLIETVTQLRGRVNAFQRAATAALAEDELGAHARSHERLLDAIAGGSRKAARDAMAEHVGIAVGRLRASLPAADQHQR